MPDNSTAVGPASATPTANTTVTSDDLEGITLAVPHNPPLSPANAAQAAPAAPAVGSTPADQLAVSLDIPQATAPLSENVSPFNKSPYPYQQVEYVPITQPLPAQPQAGPAAQPAATPVQPLPQTPPASVATPSVQALPPTPPAVTAPPERVVVQPPASPVPQPVAPVPPVPPVQPAPVAAPQLESIDSIPQFQPAGIDFNIGATTPAAPAMPVAATAPAVPPTPVAFAVPVPAPVSNPVAMASADAAFSTAAPITGGEPQHPGGPALFRPAIIFSHNTWAIWKARHSTQVLYIFALIGVVLIFIGLIMYWISIGAPTHLEDLPFIKK